MVDGTRIEELKRRVQLDPASIAFAALAEEYRRAGQYEESIATCLAGLQRHPAYLSARVTLGRALLELGRYDEAREQLEHVLRVAPENLAAIRGLAEIHHRTGDMPEVMDQEHAGPRPDPHAPAAVAHEKSSVSGPEPAPAPVPVAEPRPVDDTTEHAEPAAAAPRPAPVKVRLSTLSEPDGEASSDAPRPAVAAGQPAASMAPAPSAVAVSAAPSAIATARAAHPDEAAVPALERMLAAIVRARETIHSEHTARH